MQLSQVENVVFKNRKEIYICGFYYKGTNPSAISEITHCDKQSYYKSY